MQLKQCGAVLAALLLAAMPLRVWAAELLTPYESVPMDSYSGQLVAGGSVTQTGLSAPESGLYDAAAQRYVFATEVGTVHSTVPDGLLTTGAVCLEADNTASLTLYRNGEAVPTDQWGDLTQQGSYLLNRTDITGGSRIMGFTILGAYSGELYRYDLPSGFVTTQVQVDGEALAAGGTTVDMTREGSYSIAIRSGTGQEFSLHLTVDHTAPQLFFTGLDERNIAGGPVSVSVSEEGCTIITLLNGKAVPTRETCTEAGSYVLQVWDRAGNSASYAFTIERYLNLGSGALFAVSAVGMLIYGISLWRHRSKMRVR